MTKPLRQSMPATADFIDQMRDAFGADQINDAIRAGMNGQPTFYTKENGIEIGTRYQAEPAKTVSLADVVIGPLFPKKGEGK